jgi:16S rRNA processing protein RimM
VHNFGAGDLIEVRPAAGGDTHLLPFDDRTVPKIDIAAGRIVVAPPEISNDTPLTRTAGAPRRRRGKTVG